MTTPNQPREGDSQIDAMANAFLRWPLPENVCADLCATQQGKGRVGTHLLSFTEAKKMFQDIVGPLVLSGRIKQKIIDLQRTPPSQDAVGGTPRDFNDAIRGIDYAMDWQNQKPDVVRFATGLATARQVLIDARFQLAALTAERDEAKLTQDVLRNEFDRREAVVNSLRHEVAVLQQNEEMRSRIAEAVFAYIEKQELDEVMNRNAVESLKADTTHIIKETK